MKVETFKTASPELYTKFGITAHRADVLHRLIFDIILSHHNQLASEDMAEIAASCVDPNELTYATYHYTSITWRKGHKEEIFRQYGYGPNAPVADDRRRARWRLGRMICSCPACSRVRAEMEQKHGSATETDYQAEDRSSRVNTGSRVTIVKPDENLGDVLRMLFSQAFG